MICILQNAMKIQNIINYGENIEYNLDKFALLWGEAQLCLPYVCL